VANAMSDMAGSLFSGQPNLSMTERSMYMMAGLGLAAAGVRPRPNPLLNVLAVAAGSYLAWSGYRGQCPVKAAIMGQNGADDGRHMDMDERIASREPSDMPNYGGAHHPARREMGERVPM